MYAGKRKTNSNLAWHRPKSEGFRLEEELVHKSQQALSATTDPVERLRLLCLTRGVGGILALGRYFRELHTVSGKPVTLISKQEFKADMKQTGLDLSDHDIDDLFAKLDPDGSGLIVLDDLLKQVRPPMSESRRSIVEQAFTKLDKEGHGYISVAEIRKVYSVTSKSSYTCGEESADAILNRFLAHFETEGTETADEKVTLEEFLNYYSVISIPVENDCNFDLMMRQTYKL